MMPRNIMDSLDTWHCRQASVDEWCGGFWPGILWYTYEYNQEPSTKREAEKFTSALKFLAHTPAFDHDLGFLVFCSYGNGYRLTRIHAYKQEILDVAHTVPTPYRHMAGPSLSCPFHVKYCLFPNVIMDVTTYFYNLSSHAKHVRYTSL